jgi:hypothetical protein
MRRTGLPRCRLGLIALDPKVSCFDDRTRAFAPDETMDYVAKQAAGIGLFNQGGCRARGLCTSSRNRCGGHQRLNRGRDDLRRVQKLPEFSSSTDFCPLRQKIDDVRHDQNMA